MVDPLPVQRFLIACPAKDRLLAFLVMDGVLSKTLESVMGTTSYVWEASYPEERYVIMLRGKLNFVETGPIYYNNTLYKQHNV